MTHFDPDERAAQVSAHQVEVPGTPEEVWQAIATGPGIATWFAPAEVDERVGGRIVTDHGPYGRSEGVVKERDPVGHDPHHRPAPRHPGDRHLRPPGSGRSAPRLPVRARRRGGRWSGSAALDGMAGAARRRARPVDRRRHRGPAVHRSALNDVDGEPAAGGLLVLRLHVGPGFPHGLDNLVERDDVHTVAS